MSLLFLFAIGLVAPYTFVTLALGSQPATLRICGALSLMVLGRVWYRIHRGDRDLPLLVPFEALGIFTVGLGTGGVLHVLGLTFAVLYFRAVRGGIRSALLKSAAFAMAIFAVLRLSPPVSFSATEVFWQVTIAMQMVAITNAPLGRGLRRSARDQAALSRAHGQVGLSHHLLSEAERVAGFGSWRWDLVTGHVRVSEGMREIAGFDSLILTSREWTSVLHPDDRARVNHVVMRVLSGVEDPASVECRICGPDGDVRYVVNRARRVLT